MQHRNGDLFTTDAKIIAHGANTKGVMGAGIAKTIKEKFPENYKVYYRYCKNKLAVPGEWSSWYENNKLVVNLFSQDHPGANARYSLVASSLFGFAEFYTKRTAMWPGDIIAIPEIGSGIGGLEYDNVEKILQLVEEIYPIEFEVWHYV